MIEIIRNWKKKRQDHKQAEHEKLLVELAEMVDKRRAELLQREWVDTHMEMDWSTGKGVWYLTGTDFKGSELENKRVRVLRNR